MYARRIHFIRHISIYHNIYICSIDIFIYPNRQILKRLYKLYIFYMAKMLTNIFTSMEQNISNGLQIPHYFYTIFCIFDTNYNPQNEAFRLSRTNRIIS